MRIYADNAATTQMSQTAMDAMLPYMTTIYGNPSSLHTVGQEAKDALDAARETVAKCLGCEPREIIFTSGGSEADNQAIISAARLGEKKGKKHIISTAFEHHAVLHTLKKLEKEGFEVTLLDVRQGHNIPIPAWSPPCTPTMRSAPFSPLRRSAPSARRQACPSTPMPSRPWAMYTSM